MAVMSFSHLAKEYAGNYIFSNLSGTVEDNSIIGIVGPNGIGKSTLLQLISGKQEASDGIVSASKGVRIGYLQQEAIEAFARKENSIFDEMLTVFSHLIRMQESLSSLEIRMGEAGDVEDLLDEYGRQLQAFELAGGYNYETNIKKTLEGLGFSSDEWSLPLTHCSGGQKTRALLGRLLLEEPDLLIMDEPTNHLDAKAVEWLEGKLLRWPSAIIVVSHDRYFLDNIAKEIWEMSVNGIEKYRGNYSAYLHQRKERRELREKKFVAVMEHFMNELHYIRRYIDKKTTQAKGRMKRLVRHVKAVEIGGPEALDMKWSVFSDLTGGVSDTKWSVNELERHIRSLKCRNPYVKPMKMRIQTTGHLSEQFLSIRKAKIGFPGKELFTMEEGEILKRNRVALLGPNGSGKSTFLRTMLNEIPLLSGELKMGDTIKVGYFAQAHDMLDPNKRVVDELMSHKHGLLEAEARSYLGSYLFSNDDVFKLTRNLSGGERGRLTLAILALHAVNFLILDEPTNHLDIQSREILEDALLNFRGTILFVTHDRYLIQKIATHIWSIEGRKIVPFDNSYEEFLLRQRDKKDEVQESGRGCNKARVKSPRKTDPARALKETEEEIISLERELQIMSRKLETAIDTDNAGRIKEWKNKYHELKIEIQNQMEKWEELSIING